MEVADKVALLDKNAAVQAEALKNHCDRDDERFDHIVRGLDNLSRGFADMSAKLDKAITRAHSRIDEESTERGKQVTHLKQGMLNVRIWVLTGALTIAMGIAWYLFQQRDSQRATNPATFSGAQAAETQN
jgi:hypothetical protein